MARKSARVQLVMHFAQKPRTVVTLKVAPADRSHGEYRRPDASRTLITRFDFRKGRLEERPVTGQRPDNEGIQLQLLVVGHGND